MQQRQDHPLLPTPTHLPFPPQNPQQMNPLPSLKCQRSTSTQETQNIYFRFYQPYQFVHKHKIIHKNKSKNRVGRYFERNSAGRLIKRPLCEDAKTRQNQLQFIYDWMMQFASLLKITKNAYFRALIILQRAILADSRITYTNHMALYACAALSLGGKYECTRDNYLTDIITIYSRRISKSELINAENSILTAIKWKVPVRVLLEEDLALALGRWVAFLRAGRGQLERVLCGKCCGEGGEVMSKVYIEIVYIIDFLIIKRSEWLKEDAFIWPILISLYILFSIHIGDVHLDQHSLWPLFERFLAQERLVEDPQKIKNQTAKCFQEYRIIQILGRIPLGLNYDKVMRKRNEQFYIPKIDSC